MVELLGREGARLLSVGSVLAYVCLLGLLCWIHGSNSLLNLSVDEQRCAGMVGCVLLGACAVNLVSVAPRRASRLEVDTFSGARQTIVAVHLVAALANLLACISPLPVLVDPFTGVRMHQSRYAEWTVLAFTMTYLVETYDSKTAAAPLMIAARSAGGVAIAGLIIPNLSGYPILWALGLGFSYLNFMTVFPRVRRRMQAVRAECRELQGHDLAGSVERSLAKDLLITCACMWSLFALLYSVTWFCAWRAGDAWDHPSWPYVVETMLDVVVKLLYGLTIERAHASIPERRGAIQRQLMTSALDAMCVRFALTAPGGWQLPSAQLPRARGWKDGGGERMPLHHANSVQSCAQRLWLRLSRLPTTYPVPSSACIAANSSAGRTARTPSSSPPFPKTTPPACPRLRASLSSSWWDRMAHAGATGLTTPSTALWTHRASMTMRRATSGTRAPRRRLRSTRKACGAAASTRTPLRSL